MSNNKNTTNSTGASSTQLNGDNNSNLLNGSEANEKVDGKASEDTVSGGAGSDWVKGGAGDDRLVYVVSLNQGSTDLYDGGSGSNVLELRMTRSEWMRDEVQADVAAYLAFLTSTAPDANGKNSSSGYEFKSLGLTARRFSSLEIFVDGVAQNPADEAIVAGNDFQTSLTEHSLMTGNVTDNDDVPDLIREVSLVNGPAKGLLTLTADGSYTYDPGMEFDYLAQGENAQVQFTYRVTDADRDSATATATLTITGTNDAPVAVADSGTTDENQVIQFKVLDNDTDVDASDTHIVKTVAIASGSGTAAIVNNQIEWTPGTDYDSLALNESAAVEIDYTMSDNNNAEASSRLSITVTGSNDAPTVENALTRTASEEDAVFSIDLLEGAADKDNGAMLSVSDLNIADNKGGWSLTGNQLTIDPNYFDDLNTGDLETLSFSYKVVDEHGAAVDQTLTLNIEGFTDAPSLAAVASAGAAVNEVNVRIASQPARNESVKLSFSNLPAGAKVLNAARSSDVTAGVENFIGVHDFIVVLPATADADFDFGMTVTGLRPDGSAIASTSGAIDFVYQHNSVTDSVAFSSQDQGIWASGPAPMVQWHEYIPLVGGKTKEWNTTTSQWVDTDEGPWTSGTFSLLSAEVSADQAKQIARNVAQNTLNAARDVFNWASNTVDAVAQATYDLAVTTFNSAVATAESIFNAAASGALNAFNAAVGAISQVAEDVAIGIYDTAVDVADGIRDTAIAVFGWMGGWVSDAANAVYDESVKIAKAALDAALAGVEWTEKAIKDAAQATYDGAVAAATWVKNTAVQAANATFKLAQDAYNLAKQKAFEAAEVVFDAAETVFESTLSALDRIQGKTSLDVNADLYAEVGLQVNFVLDSGSVDTEVLYDLASTLQHNHTTDVLVITPKLINLTTGDTVAFETISPNASLKAVLLYDVGANLNVLLDSNLVIDGNTLWDITPNGPAINIGTNITTGGWGDDFENLKSVIESLPGAGDINFDGVAVGELVLIDLNTADLDQFEVPFIGTLTQDIVTLEVGLPTIKTEGKAAAYDPAYFAEGGLVAIDIGEVTGSVMNLINARLDISPELRQQLGLASLQSTPSLAAAVALIGEALLGTLIEALDGQSDSTPIFLLDANDETSGSLVHLNIFPDSVMGSSVNENTAKYGFYTTYGESNELVKVTIDIDQAVAVIVNKIIEAAAAAGTSGATVQFLQALPDINPLDLEFGLAEIMKVIEAPQQVIDEITKFFDLSIGFEAADLDVYSSIKFSQEFTLSIDDVAYMVTMEDGEKYMFAANADGSVVIENASRHDANGDGVVDYDMTLVPKAMFSNDTEIGLTIGYVLDFLQASLAADLKLPIDELLSIDIPGLPDIKLNLADVNLGPLLRIQGDLDLASADIFESRFDFDIGSAEINGSYELQDEQLVTIVGVMPA